MRCLIKMKYSLVKSLNKIMIPAVICMVFAFMTGCGRNADVEKDDGRLKVVTTIFPYYDFVRQVAGDKVNLSMAVPAGMDTHSFEPTAADMIDIGKADIVIYNGGEMETWVDEVLEAASNDNVVAAEMMDYVDVVMEETVEGMQESAHNHDSHEEDIHEEDIHSEEDYHGEAEYDEHIWTSPVNAQKLVMKIVDILSEADKDNADYYKKNGESYNKKLSELDKRFREIVNSSDKNYLVFGDRFPLRYFTDEYGLEYSAAFAGCSADIEPSADTLAFLTDKVKDENIKVILKIELTNSKVADTIAETTGAKVMTFYTCHNVTREQFDDGVTYYDLMRENVEVLKKALV